MPPSNKRASSAAETVAAVKKPKLERASSSTVSSSSVRGPAELNNLLGQQIMLPIMQRKTLAQEEYYTAFMALPTTKEFPGLGLVHSRFISGFHRRAHFFCADYKKKVKQPIALKTIEAKVKKRQYRSKEEFLQDIKLLRDNCYKYMRPSCLRPPHMDLSRTRAHTLAQWLDRAPPARKRRYCKGKFPQLLPVADELVSFAEQELSSLTVEFESEEFSVVARPQDNDSSSDSDSEDV
jgi:hypothetical protein